LAIDSCKIAERNDLERSSWVINDHVVRQRAYDFGIVNHCNYI